jgi:hypothetical protein
MACRTQGCSQTREQEMLLVAGTIGRMLGRLSLKTRLSRFAIVRGWRRSGCTPSTPRGQPGLAATPFRLGGWAAYRQTEAKIEGRRPLSSFQPRRAGSSIPAVTRANHSGAQVRRGKSEPGVSGLRRGLILPAARPPLDFDRRAGLESQAPQTSRRIRIQFSPMTLRMRASFQPRLDMATVRLG